jgi:hypothetical protein
MCCFSRPVKDVSATKIFARWVGEAGDGLRQCVVYQMNYKASEELAMVLPIPSAPGSGESATRFISLEKHADLFDRLHDCFPAPEFFGGVRSRSTDGAKPPLEKLAVVEVGSYEASFVPTVADFARLDERFRLPAGVWESLPEYAKWGFAVFKLKPAATTVHPMAFTFPQAGRGRGLFFPTVHIHDGRVHKTAGFDHTLYAQGSPLHPATFMDWEESPGLAGGTLRSDYLQLVDPKRHVYRKRLRGRLPNADQWV